MPAAYSRGMRKFLAGDANDTNLCVALQHEFLRCHEALMEFRPYASQATAASDNKWLSFRTYSAYSRFIHYPFPPVCEKSFCGTLG
jgi:hypothetical protein